MPKVRPLDHIEYKKRQLIYFIWGEARRLGVTQEQMEHELGVSHSTMWRKRKQETYTVEDLMRMLRVINADAETVGRMMILG